MAEQSALQAALQRLEGALAGLDEASAALAEAAEEPVRRHRGQAVMAADRARLAEALDAATARAERLELSRRDAARRLDQAIESVRSLLDEGGARSGAER
ncbi:MAG TPA: DUF4164 family protein [Hyphomicrobiales bacterium]|nr:DUF4164 family protein [Hyphomicrobiales bacterium]